MTKTKTPLLEEGDIIELKVGHKVYADIPEHFVFDNCKGSFKMTHHEVVIDAVNFSYFAGRYVVYKTVFHGGGTGMGPHDVYPDGHHVYCEKLDDRSVKADFYQSGCFTAMIESIKPVGRAVRQWTEEKV